MKRPLRVRIIKTRGKSEVNSSTEVSPPEKAGNKRKGNPQKIIQLSSDSTIEENADEISSAPQTVEKTAA